MDWNIQTGKVIVETGMHVCMPHRQCVNAHVRKMKKELGVYEYACAMIPLITVKREPYYCTLHNKNTPSNLHPVT